MKLKSILVLHLTAYLALFSACGQKSGSDLPSDLLLWADNGQTGFELYRSDGTSSNTTLVKDFTTRTDADTNEGASIGDVFYFVAGKDNFGNKLWKSDGTESGTTIVKDFNPGPPSSNPYGLTAVGNTLYFVINRIDHSELWKSDGSETGTVLVKELRGALYYTPAYFQAVGDQLFFVSITFDGPYTLWKSDGSEDGTTIVSTLPAGTYFNGDFKSTETQLFFFVHNTIDHDTCLWTSDGSQEGTIKLCDSPLKIDNGRTCEIVDSTLYFFVDDTSNGSELWKSDGTLEGTTLVKESLAPHNCVVIRNTLYFFQSQSDGFELWKSDGTEQGTILVTETILEKFSNQTNFDVKGVARVGENFYFILKNEYDIKSSLWKSDGTSDGTVLVSEINNVHQSFVQTLENKMIFPSTDQNNNVGLIVSDGTSDGTKRLILSTANDVDVKPHPMFVAGNKLFFWANQGDQGYELWASDGTETGSYLVKDINKSITANSWLSFHGQLPDGTMIVSREDDLSNLTTLWKTDGTETGTQRLVQFDSEQFKYEITNFVFFKDALYFRANGKQGQLEFWRTDGTAKGTVKYFELFKKGNTELHVAGNNLFFTVYYPDSLFGYELWKSDGSSIGSEIFPDLKLEHGSLEAMGDRVFFSAWDDEHGFELWLSDGTNAGTKMVKDISQGRLSSSIDFLGSANGVLYFVADGGLWRSDGTTDGTQSIELKPSLHSTFANFTPLKNGRFYFTLAEFNEEVLLSERLFLSDGTSQGTQELKSFNADNENRAIINWITVADVTTYFKLTHSTRETQLWRSDGTTEGTYQIKNAPQIYKNSYFYKYPTHENYTVRGDIIYFAGSDAEHGTELWKSDGTESGTTMVTDLYLGTYDGLRSILK